MRKLVLPVMAAAVAVGGWQTAFGFLEFQKVWIDLYVDKTDKSEENQEYVKLVSRGTTRCLVCHQGRKRTNHNPYGQHFIHGVLTEDDKKDKEKIVRILTEVGKLPADPNDEATVTYNDLIAAKKLPGGTLEDLKKDPPGEEGDEGDEEGN